MTHMHLTGLAPHHGARRALRCVSAFAGVLMAIACTLVWAPTTALAVKGRVTQGNLEPLKIAVPAFLGRTAEDSALGAQISRIIEGNLERSGLFAPIDEAAFIERDLDASRRPRFNDWRVVGAEALTAGTITKGPGGGIDIAFRLWDVFAGRQSTGQTFNSANGNWRRIAHLISDVIYERLTGEQGYFDTRVVFIDETGAKNRRRKRLAIMDQDGANVRTLSDGNALVLTPRFSPTRQQIVYLSYETGMPRVHLMDLNTGRNAVLGDFPGITYAPRFSPDGRKVVMSLQEEGAASLFEMDLATRQRRRLTRSTSIDTAPSYAPDGGRIVFESDRQGGQQLFVMNADGTDQRRISFGEGRYSTPVWSPRGDLIAFTKQLSGRFLIGVIRPDGSGERILTGGFHNEGPTWAPNGRVLMFFREERGEGGPSLYSIDLTGYNELRVPTPSFASDPAWSPPLTVQAGG